MPSEIDRLAMGLAIEQYRARGKKCSDHIDRFLAEDGFEEAGEHAAYSCQCKSLGLKPWQCPPLWIDPSEIKSELAAPPDIYGRHRAAELLQKMLRLGISRFHPNPVAALEAAAPKPAR